MKKYIFFIMGLISFIGGFIVKFIADRKIWIQVYPPPPEKILLNLAPLILWIVGMVFIGMGITCGINKKKKEDNGGVNKAQSEASKDIIESPENPSE